MRHHIVRAIVVACIIGGTTLAFAYSFGPPPSRTGAPAVGPIIAENNCTLCHTGNALNDPRGKLEILDIPDGYSFSQVIPIRVRLSFDHTQTDSVAPYKWGFELTAVQASTGKGIGTFSVIPPDLQVVNGATTMPWKTRRYVEHTTTGTHTGEVGPVEWTFNWTAPPGDSGAIYFFAAGNAANGDGLHTPDNGGDFIFTARDTIVIGGIVDVPRNFPPPTFRNVLAAPYPNPMRVCTDIDFTIARPGMMDLTVFDAQGRKVQTLRHEWHDAGAGANFWDGAYEDGTEAPNGIYFVRLRGPGDTRIVSRKIILAR
jgi:hypothetical protein